MNQTTYIYNSKTAVLLLLSISLVFIGIGIYLLMTEEASPANWVVVLLFSAGALVFVRQLFDKRPRIILDAEGIEDRKLKGVGKILWLDIKNAYIKRMRGIAFICLELHDPEKYLPSQGALHKAQQKADAFLGVTPLIITTSYADRSEQEILALIQAHLT
nr:STM3941 family protein [uncultured Desulfobulbus sp.]